MTERRRRGGKGEGDLFPLVYLLDLGKSYFNFGEKLF